MNGFPVAPPADAHGFFFRPTKVIGKGGEAAAQPVQTDFRQAVTGGASPQYWNREATYNEATEKYRDNRARLLHGLSAEDRALYDEYRSTEREMGAMLDGSMLYDESRMDELYRELYGKEWFGKLNRYDRILGDASEAVKEFYWNTAGGDRGERHRRTPPDDRRGAQKNAARSGRRGYRVCGRNDGV